MVRFPIGLDFPFITSRLHFFLSWMYYLSNSSFAIFASIFINHVFLCLPTLLLPSNLISIHLFHLAGVGDGGVVVVSAGHVGGTRISVSVSSAADVLRVMREVVGVCEMCMCLARVGVGGDGVSG